MSVVKYNSLIFEIRERLDELNVGRKLHFMCRGKVAPRGEENMQNLASSLIAELEEKEFLGPDNLDLLKDLLKDIKEWAFLEEVEKFESKRKEYFDLLEQIIRALDELNDLERLLSICSGKIPRERQGNICDVRSLFEELKINNFLGINRLGILKEILAQTGTSNLLMAVKEFDERRTREDKFERRKARAAEIVSTARNNLTGVLTIRNVFKGIAGGIVIVSAFELLRRHSTYDQLVTAVNTYVLPACTKLIEIAEGSVNLKVHAENCLALDNLWRMYKNGSLKAGLQALLVTDEMIEFAGGEQVEVTVTIDEEEYIKARGELTTESTVSSSNEPVGQEERQLQYLDQEKLSYITNYLEQTRDTDVHSVSTEDDSGKAASNSAPSEFGFEETSDSTSKLCLKDLSMELTEELTSKLNRNKDVLNRFYRSFGLDPDLLHDELDRRNIGKIFPDTPVKLLKEVFEALKLYDFAEFLEKATKPRTLRPALPLKEIEKLSSVGNRPTKVYSKAKVLIVDVCEACESSTDNDVETAGSFFKAQNSRNEVTTLKTDFLKELLEDLDGLARGKIKEESDDSRTQSREARLKTLLKKKIPGSWIKSQAREEFRGSWYADNIPDEVYFEEEDEIYMPLRSVRFKMTKKDEQQLAMFSKEEPAMRNELEKLTEKRKQWKTERKPLIEKQIKEKEEELRKETEKFEMAVLSVIDNWLELHPNDKGKASTLFVVLVQNSVRLDRTRGVVLQQMIISIKRSLFEKLALIPETKVLITNNVPLMGEVGIIASELLKVYLSGKGVLTTLLQLLSKRLDTLDLISVMQELKRTVPQTVLRYYRYHEDVYKPVEIRDNLSSLPRLQKTE